MMDADEGQIRAVLDAWCRATRQGRSDAALSNHRPDAMIYDVLAPLRYEGVAAYRRSLDEWQPETQDEGRFDLEDLVVTAGAETAFAHGLLRCGGTLADGRTFEDLVRATVCLVKSQEGWMIAHQHISKPLNRPGG